jgi:hypothetical protein
MKAPVTEVFEPEGFPRAAFYEKWELISEACSVLLLATGRID